jgi:hypothetical protein
MEGSRIPPFVNVLAFDNVLGANNAAANPVIAGVGKTICFKSLVEDGKDFRSDDVTRFAILIDTIALYGREPCAPVMQMLTL